MEGTIDFKMVFSGLSFIFTGYFWFVKSRKERPNLEFVQLANYRAICRRHPEREGVKRLCVQQLNTGGVLIVNHSTRQNSVVLFECFLQTGSGEVAGDWGYSGEDKPPWNIGPESTIAFSPAFFFDVPEDYELPENLHWRVRFVTASGKKFTHTFHKEAPRFGMNENETRRAA